MPNGQICVYGGPSTGRSERYAAAARELGTLLAQRGIGVVYGGASVGTMGILADAEALTREVKEETGIQLHAGSIAPCTVVRAEARGHPAGTRVRLAAFTADRDGEPAARGEVAELAGLGYQERERCAPAMRAVMDRLHEQGRI